MTETFTEIIERIFGSYQPIDIVNTSGEVIAAEPDYGYIFAMVLFAICLWFLCKTIGGVIYEWLRR